MSRNKAFKVLYDKNADVLYITVPNKMAERGIEDEFGLVWRYDLSGRALGCTIVDFADYWYPARSSQLSAEISRNLGLAVYQVKRILDHAIGQ